MQAIKYYCPLIEDADQRASIQSRRIVPKERTLRAHLTLSTRHEIQWIVCLSRGARSGKLPTFLIRSLV